jgi:hypothetical protein
MKVDKSLNTSEVGYVGTLKFKLKDVRNLLGVQCRRGGEDDKWRMEWKVNVDGKVISVYDWKKEESLWECEWHVGDMDDDDEVVEKLNGMIEKNGVYEGYTTGCKCGVNYERSEKLMKRWWNRKCRFCRDKLKVYLGGKPVEEPSGIRKYEVQCKCKVFTKQKIDPQRWAEGYCGKCKYTFAVKNKQTGETWGELKQAEEKKEIKLTIMKKRLVKEDFDKGPIKAKIQTGEIFGSKYEWYEIAVTELIWSDKCNMNGEQGINVEHGGGYAGFNNGVYHRYKYPSEHCMRILEIYKK